MNTQTKQLTSVTFLLIFATTLLVLISAFLPGVSYAQSRSDLGQPNPRANLYRGGSDYTRYSGSSSSYRTVASGLSASCAASHFNPSRGQAVTWFASATGGSGAYSYAWSGTDGLSGNTNTVVKAYATNGDKFATLSVTSGNQMITVSCASLVVGASGGAQTVTSPGFGASCYSLPENALPGESVTWLSIVSGVTASTTYAWDGTDGLSGDRPMVSKTYTSNGVKAAMLTVTNGQNRIVAACVNGARIGPTRIATDTSVPSPTTSTGAATEIQGTCAPSITKATTNEEVIWSVTAIGGNGSFQFLWKGHESLMGTLASTTKVYTKEGVKKAEVTVVSGNKSKVITCSTGVEIVKGWNGLTAASLFSWLNGFWGFLLIFPIAILIGIVIARRKRAKEEEAEEKDHVH